MTTTKQRRLLLADAARIMAALYNGKRGELEAWDHLGDWLREWERLKIEERRNRRGRPRR